MPSTTSDAELRSFLGPDGKTTRDGQRRAGMWQAGMGQPLTARLPWESPEAFRLRAAAYESMKAPPPPTPTNNGRLGRQAKEHYVELFWIALQNQRRRLT